MKTKNKLMPALGAFMLGGALAFAQTPPSANQLAWWNADTGVMVSGGVVQTWTNQQSTPVDNRDAVYQYGNPTYNPSLTFPNGTSHGAIMFDGASGLLGNNPQDYYFASNAISVYVVGSLDHQDTQDEFVGFWPGVAFGCDDGSPGYMKWYLNGVAPNELKSTTILSNDVLHVLTGTFVSGSPGTRVLYIDSVVNNTDAPANPISFQSAQLGIGTLANYNIQNLNGKIAEILMYSTVDKAQQGAVEAYLQNKYFYNPGIASIVTQPQPVTVTEPVGVQFSVVPNGTFPFTFQWFSNNVPIPGATLATFSIPSTRTFDSANYSVVVSNALGHVQSQNAVLTVLQHTTPPVLLTASRAFSSDRTITLAFDLPMDPTTADNVANYSFNSNNKVISAVLNTNGTNVTITASEGIDYPTTITVSGVQSIYGISVATTAALINLPYSLPNNFYASVNGAQDTFQEASLKTNWQSTLVYAGEVDSNYLFNTSWVLGNGVLHCADSATNVDGNFLVYVDPAYDGSPNQSVLMRMTITASSFNVRAVAGCALEVPLDSEFAVARGGLDMVAVPAKYNPTGPAFPYFHTYSDFVADLADNTNLEWHVGGSYWLRLQTYPTNFPNAVGLQFNSKVWPADGITPEPANWDVTEQDPAGVVRQGLGAIRAGWYNAAEGIAIMNFDVQYFQVTSPGLPLIQPVLPPTILPQISVGITVGGGNAVISWPNAAPGTYTVQSRSSLTSGTWSDVGVLTVVNGGQNTVSVPYNPAQPAFYRLIAR